ncbi:hypothetical protein SGQ44_00330 [Flavobacterium sp. Fl-77]|uniref:Lipoprotein n=1 Tax=Flavobacterium flavipigmentatum TaxID=2893884 RepID=A0AAJ2SD57_9FLAO|nr:MULTISPECIES: hypothetical protein [unclassified Flavobacterium]MDX6180579.1 hypothetical protein [Flavobacterium sp. Fl-33]MDX6184179.1 hypothetical protein [Flavobacterium sp. Fl-77]UFH39292.1 hypothetical protein LNP22_03230 [Flavobacterium sp. F-70]
MKKLALSLTFLSLILASCSSSDEDTVTPPATGSGEITGDITVSKTFIKGTYTLSGTVRVKSGATLTFDAGSTITADVANGTDALLVEKGGKLIITGTAAEPVVFTEKSKTAGSWGGIIMFGEAPIVSGKTADGTPITTATSEDGTNIIYGGAKADDNSGSLKYVRVEYAGKKILDGNSEMNGFSFYAVGSGTVLENLVAYKGADDGFEFYGGTVSAKNLISYGNTDDSFDWQDGWQGQANTNWFAYQTGAGNFGMEIEAKSVNNAFFPKVSNITLRRAAGTVTEAGNPTEIDAVQFKKEGNGEYSNVVISGYTSTGAVAVRIQEAATNTNQVSGGKIKMLNVKVVDAATALTGTGATGFTVAFPTGNLTTSTTATGATLTAGAWAIVDGVNLLEKL